MTVSSLLGDSVFERSSRAGLLEDDQVVTLSLGPQHPRTHGVLRLILQLQGETVIHADIEMGWLHRSTEKLGEARTYVQCTVLTDRLDYVSPLTKNWAYALTKLVKCSSHTSWRTWWRSWIHSISSWAKPIAEVPAQLGPVNPTKV